MPCLLLTPLGISILGGSAAAPLSRTDKVRMKSPSLSIVTLWATSPLPPLVEEVLDPWRNDSDEVLRKVIWHLMLSRVAAGKHACSPISAIPCNTVVAQHILAIIDVYIEPREADVCNVCRL